MSEPSGIALFFGRFHPLLVHLPIGILLLLGFLELLAQRPHHRKAACNAGYLLAVAAPVSILSAALGWLLSRADGYEENLLGWHFWTGISTAVLCVITAVLYRMQALKAYRTSLAFTLVALVAASHFGGSLTHGSDYLVRYAPDPIRTLFKPGAAPNAVSRESQSAYAHVIHPILEKACVNCHGPEKAKGRLRVDTYEHLIRGGDSGPGIVAGRVAESAIIKRMRLPLDDEDHMPPEGKSQPSAEEIALIEGWINAGASRDIPASSLEQASGNRRVPGK